MNIFAYLLRGKYMYMYVCNFSIYRRTLEMLQVWVQIMTIKQILKNHTIFLVPSAYKLCLHYSLVSVQ